MKQIPAPIWTLTVGVAVTLISLWVGQNHGWLPEQASAQSVLVDRFFDVMVVIGTALFLVVEGAIVYCMVQFRRPKGDDSDGLPIEGNLPLEAFWTAIPAVIVIGLGVYSVQVFQEMGGFSPGGGMGGHDHGTMVAQAPGTPMHDLLPASGHGDGTVGDGTLIAKSVYGFGAPLDREGQTADLSVNVAGMQYAWIFTYPDTGIVDGELHVPVNADVQLNLSATDVIHSFWVPQFRLKQDAIPGKDTELRFVAIKPGTYPVICAELCGGYHGAMRTQVIVHTPEDYQAWLDQRLAQGPTAASAIAQNPADLSAPEYLAPYGEALGVEPGLVTQLASSLPPQQSHLHPSSR
ncbi:cytochrome c oxidase subunit II [Leptolyngbya sp. PCC 6406]|uniref:cytochrome c oxidase subunit II n=1 Tax=Leptolyngbya sp. PCC 6406 TaxID=1173264 RepID=UPI0002ABEBD4|nr:cytochrome c oxidase subunit II [Leptolyngbya sp. PCC 6406]